MARVTTYGFRGEALSSLCTLASVEVVTKCSDSALTFVKMVQRGQVIRKGPADAHRTLGTTVSVRDFFYNMPVRRKQMSSGYELERIKQTLERIALVHPQVRFYLYDTTKGSTILHTRQLRTLRASFEQLFGSVDGLCEVEHCAGPYTFRGLLSYPNRGHHSKSLQFLYVNKRSVKAKEVRKFINESYLSLSLRTVCALTTIDGEDDAANGSAVASIQDADAKTIFNKYAVFLLDISCPPSAYDVTLDPTKTLVEFKDWGQVLQATASMLCGVWAGESLAPAHQPDHKESEHYYGTRVVGLGETTTDPDHLHASRRTASDLNPFAKRQKRETEPSLVASSTAPEVIKREVNHQNASSRIALHLSAHALQRKPFIGKAEASIQSTDCTYDQGTQLAVSKDVLKKMRVINQVDTKFILAKEGDMLYILDQHAVDERIGLEKLEYEAWGSDGEPANVSSAIAELEFATTAPEARLLERYHARIDAWGWKCSVENRGSRTQVLVRAVPAIDGVPLTNVDNLREFVTQLEATNGSAATKPRSIVRLLQSKACRGALMFGDRLSREDCQALIDRVSTCALPFQCAHGRPSVVPLLRLTTLPARNKKARNGRLDHLRLASRPQTLPLAATYET